MGRNHKNRIVLEVDPIYANMDDNKHTSYRMKSLRVAAYTCVITGFDTPLEIQKRYYETAIPAHPTWEYVGLYADEEIGKTSVHSRKEFNRMLEDCKEGKIDLIFIKALSCLTWKITDHLNTIELLQTLHPPVDIYIEENNFNTFGVGTKPVLDAIAMYRDLKNAEIQDRRQESKVSETDRRSPISTF